VLGAIPAPVTVNSIAQKPIEGVSMDYTFDEANAMAPSPHKTQYFEMMGGQSTRTLDRQHQSRSAAVGRRRGGEPGSGQQHDLRTVRPDQGLDAKQGRCH